MKTIVLAIAAVALCALNSCSTMQGLGHDVQKAGNALSTSAERAAAE